MPKEQKEIEEIAETIFKSGVALDGSDFMFGIDGDDHFTRLAKKLYNAGYRKADEARKETARELAKKLLACGQESENGEVYPHDIKNVVKELYGVEIEL